MKELFETAQLVWVRFESKDVITTSGGDQELDYDDPL